ncbi:MAG TPA: hypothetical protein VFC23_18490 [Thermoanaerobaculia bacterium]|nr:hypothetical protein [Thermoanaerobaculia bacterium]
MSKSPARPARRLFLVFLLTLASAALLAQGAMALSVSLYRYYNPGNGDHFYTTNWNELGNGGLGYYFEWVQCHIDSRSGTGNTPFYRYYNSGTGAHFYSTDFYEAPAGFSFEWVQGYVYTYNFTGSLVPLYRYYNAGTDKYFYTTNYNELGGGAQGFAYQKIAAWVNP